MQTARTTLTPETLATLSAQGRAEAAQNGRFVDPCTVAQATRLLRERGETWAASVLMRPNLSARRSLIAPAFPWFEDGELETLILAHQAEWDQLRAAAQAD